MELQKIFVQHVLWLLGKNQLKIHVKIKLFNKVSISSPENQSGNMQILFQLMAERAESSRNLLMYFITSERMHSRSKRYNFMSPSIQIQVLCLQHLKEFRNQSLYASFEEYINYKTLLFLVPEKTLYNYLHQLCFQCPANQWKNELMSGHSSHHLCCGRYNIDRSEYWPRDRCQQQKEKRWRQAIVEFLT